MRLRGRPCASNSITSSGTMIAPPPMPQHPGEEADCRADCGVAQPPFHDLVPSPGSRAPRVFSAALMCSPHLVRRHSTSSASRAHSFFDEVVELALVQAAAEVAAEVALDRASPMISSASEPCRRSTRAARSSAAADGACGSRAAGPRKVRPSQIRRPAGASVCVHAALPGKRHGELRHRLLGELAVSRDLAAEHREQRRIVGPGALVEQQVVVARHRRRVVAAVVVERAHARIASTPPSRA